MNENIFENNVGYPIITFIVPFIFILNKNRLTKFEKKGCVSAIDQTYTSDDVIKHLKPQNEVLAQFFAQDSEEYSFEYIKLHPFRRTLVKNILQFENFEVTSIISSRNDGYGSIIAIYKSLKPLSVDLLLTETKKIRSFLELLFYDSTKNEGKKIFNDYFNIVYNSTMTELTIGVPYSFYNFYHDKEANLEINDLNQFIDINYLSVYGILNQDYTGWRRTKSDVAKKILNDNLSRRVEYVFFVTPVSAVEIDNKTRMETIKKWADRHDTTFELMQLKLIIERILSLETLTIQKFLLINIDNNINNIISMNSLSSKDVLKAKSKISNDLCDYYNIRSQNEYHVSGEEWIEYGQKMFGINKIFYSLMNRLSLLESISKDSEAEKKARGTFWLSLISLVFSLQTVINLCSWIFSSPFLNGITDTIVWWITFSIIVVIGAFMIFLFIKHNKRRR